MEITKTTIEGLLHIQPKVWDDERGYFFESYNKARLDPHINMDWVQDNESQSTRGVLRGLHYQLGEMAQAKLVRAVTGEIYDVAVDIRPESPTYGQWYGVVLSADRKNQLLVPRGCAHGFLVLSETAIFSYKCDNFYSHQDEAGIVYNDENLNIEWPHIDGDFILSGKDKRLPKFGHHRPYYKS